MDGAPPPPLGYAPQYFAPAPQPYPVYDTTGRLLYPVPQPGPYFAPPFAPSCPPAAPPGFLLQPPPLSQPQLQPPPPQPQPGPRMRVCAAAVDPRRIGVRDVAPAAPSPAAAPPEQTLASFLQVLGPARFWRTLAAGAPPPMQRARDASPAARNMAAVAHVLGCYIEALAFFYEDDDDNDNGDEDKSHAKGENKDRRGRLVFEHSCSTQERVVAHSVAEVFRFFSSSEGFHPKRRVVAVKDPTRRAPVVPQLSVGRIWAIVHRALQNDNVISETEKKNAARANARLPQHPAATQNGSDEEGDDDEDVMETAEECDAVTSATAVVKEETRVWRSVEVQTEPVGTVDEAELVNDTTDALEAAKSTDAGSLPLDVLCAAEEHVCARHSVHDFGALRHGSFLRFSQKNPKLAASVSAVCTAGSPGAALSRDSRMERALSAFISDFSQKHGTEQGQDARSVATLACTQLGLDPAVHAEGITRLANNRTEGSKSIPGLHFSRVLCTPQCGKTHSAPRLWPAVTVQEAVSIAENAECLVVCVDGGLAVPLPRYTKQADGSGLGNALRRQNAAEAVEELVGLVCTYGGPDRLPVALLEEVTRNAAENTRGLLVDILVCLHDWTCLVPPDLVNKLFIATLFDGFTPSTTTKYTLCGSVDVSRLLNDFSEYLGMPQLKVSQTTRETSETNEMESFERKSDDNGHEERSMIPLPEVQIPQHDKGDCKEFVERLLREDFGVGATSLSDEGRKLLQVQHDRVARALERLSVELYSHDSHFLYELLQNADDNTYDEGVVPSIEFVLFSECLVIRNNEHGFSHEDVRAICDVGRSTKTDAHGSDGGNTQARGGEKGIGFKAVFRVTDEPRIHSNGFHIQFSAFSKPVAYILPQWVASEPEYQRKDWNTTMVLPWRPAVRAKLEEFAAQLSSIDPSSVLFLRRLRVVRIVDFITDRTVHITLDCKHDSRFQMKNNKTELRTVNANGDESRWLMVEERLTNPLQQRKGKQVAQTTVALGFPVDENNAAAAGRQCNAYALLPVQQIPFDFAVHGDFITTASRESVDSDSPWNQLLRSALANLFVTAVQQLFVPSPTKLATTWPRFLPKHNKSTTPHSAFFDAMATLIIDRVSTLACIPVISLSYGMAHEALVVPARARTCTSNELYKLLDCIPDSWNFDLVGRVVPEDCALALHTLGVVDLDAPGIVAMLNSVPCTSEHAYPMEWLARLFVYLGTHFRSDPKVRSQLALLQSSRFIPVQNGTFMAVTDKPSPRFFVDANNQPILAEGTEDECIVSPKLFSEAENDEARSTISMFLQAIGVRGCSEHAFYAEHVVKQLEATSATEDNKSLLEGLAKHFIACRLCQSDAHLAEKLQRHVPVRCTCGASFTVLDGVHFATTNRNPGLGEQLHLDESTWRVVAKDSKTEWVSFLRCIGVSSNMVAYRTTTTRRCVDSNNKTLLVNGVSLGSSVDGDYLITDWTVPELERVWQSVSTTTERKERIERITRLTNAVLEVLTTNPAALEANATYTDTVSHETKTVTLPSSVSAFLRTHKVFAWEDHLYTPGQTAIRCDENERILGHAGPYAKPGIPENVATALGVAQTVTVPFLAETLRRWSYTKHTAQLLTLEQMTTVLKTLHSGMSQQDFAALFTETQGVQPCKILCRTSTDGQQVTQFCAASSVFISEPTGLAPSLGDSYPHEMLSIFQTAGIAQQPTAERYLASLEKLSGIPTAAAASLAYRILCQLGRQTEPPYALNKEQCAKFQNEAWLPTTSCHWLSISDGIFLDDMKVDARHKHFRPQLVYTPLTGGMDEALVKFAKQVGLPLISEKVSYKVFPERCVEEKSFIEQLHQHLGTIQRFLKKSRASVYNALPTTFLSAVETLRAMSCKSFCVRFGLGEHGCGGGTENYFYEPQNNMVWFRRDDRKHNGDIPKAFFDALTQFFLNFGTLCLKDDQGFSLFLTSLFSTGNSLPEVFSLLLCDESEIQPGEQWQVKGHPDCNKESDEEAVHISEPTPKRAKKTTPVSLAQLEESDKQNMSAVTNDKQISVKAFEEEGGDDDEKEEEEKEHKEESVAASETTTTTRQEKPQVMPGINGLSQEDAREVGKWGEELCLVLLKKEYPNGL